MTPTYLRTSISGYTNPMEFATLHAFESDPALVWGWYEWRRMGVMQAEPNDGHLAITALQRKLNGLSLITQNVDDLHERAGSYFVRHLHGTIQQPRCMACGKAHTLPKFLRNRTGAESGTTPL